MAVNFSAALPPARSTGDSGPAADMNLVRAALIELRTAVTNLAGGTVVDTTAPTISSFTATPGSTTAALAWGAVDDVAVTNCTITRGGTIRYQGNARTFTDTGLTNGTPYSWTLTVYDAAGNTRTATATATPTAGATPADTTAPTVPTGLAVLQVTSTTANLAWAASTDSSGVATYDVYVNGSKVASAPGSANPFYVATGLSPDTAYTFRVAAVDTAGNKSAQSTAVTATTAAASSSGTSVPTGNLTGWTLVMAQDFTTDAALGTFATKYPNWAGYDGGTDTSENGHYDSSKVVSVSNSILTKHLHTENGVHYVAALTVPLINNTAWSGQTYGRYAVRFKADNIPGYKLAWLQWPLSDDWTDGEIDFPEADFGGTIGGFSHDVTGDPSDNAWGIDTGVTMDDWHTCVVEWKPGSLTYILDGVAKTTTNAAAIPTKGMRWCLQTETSLDTEPSDSVSGNVYIDWIAAWSYTP